MWRADENGSLNGRLRAGPARRSAGAEMRLPPQMPGVGPPGVTSAPKAAPDWPDPGGQPGEGIGATATASCDAPLVTCIMPTGGRPAFARNAVRLFEAQDYPRRELVVVDESVDGRLERSLGASPRIRFVQAIPRESIGRKRNRACAAAAGEYIAHWDDDDWYGASRLSTQLRPLIAGRADVTGLMAPLFFDVSSWWFWAVTPTLHRRLFVQDVHGGTLVYRRALWERVARYPDASLAEDAHFLAEVTRRGARLQRIPADGLFVYVRHGGNAWSFRCGEHGGRAGWVRAGEPPLPPEDREFYLGRCEAEVGARGQDARPAGEDQGDRGSAGFRGMLSRDPAVPGPRGDPPGHRDRALPSAAPRRAGGSAWGYGCRPAPLVSCIMPTKDRRALISRAVACFQRQDYANRELVVLDDGDDPVGDLVPVHPRVRYVRLKRRLVLGEKRNHACELARGSIIVHWDDDDWYAPHRISYQVEQLQSHGADVCGPDRVLYFEPVRERAWLYQYPATGPVPWAAGNGLCYHIDAWRQSPFAEIEVGEDTLFVRSRASGAVLVHQDHRFMVALIHGSNSDRKLTSSAGWRPHALGEVRALLASDYHMYEDAASPSRAGGTFDEPDR